MTPWDLIQKGVLHTNGLLLFLFGLTAVWVASSYIRLRRIPGPFLASLTNIPRPMLRSYEDRIAIYQDQLIKRIEDFKGGEINITDIFNLYNFDAMGDLAFGTSFKMLQNNEQYWAVKLLHRGMMPLGFNFPTWLFRVLLAIPGATGDWFAFKDYCCQRLEERMNVRTSA